ncbi:MAG: hypothetical protein GX160_11020 [Clostridiales bacterium]|mgnify:CR=1 FL=1|nr:hypothetical protein [Clostridiales bacterium]
MNISKLLEKIKRSKSKIKITYTKPIRQNRPIRVITINKTTLRFITLGLVVAFTIGFGIYSFSNKDRGKNNKNLEESSITAEDNSQKNLPPIDEPEEAEEEVELPIIDLSDSSVALETELMRINEPIPYDNEVLYSAGNSESIDEPVFQDLYVMNLDTGQETVIAHTEIKFGEIYEGRFNKDWIVWLDTNQSGENQLYVMNRATGEVSKIKNCDYNKPQLRLAGDNLVWVEQKDVNQDRLYLYNFKSGEPVVLEIFDNPTYGTCPPSISEELLIWVVPSDEDPDNKSFIKVLDLSKALSADLAASSQGEDPANQDSGAESIPQEEGVDPEILDPKGFAIYPATNGKAIAWLDNLNPSEAHLKLTIDNGKTIIDVDENVARPYGIGDGFIAYMKDDAVMVYFWELDRYAQLNKPGTKARLTQDGVSGNKVIWYCAENPNDKKDQLYISTVEEPIELSLGSN